MRPTTLAPLIATLLFSTIAFAVEPAAPAPSAKPKSMQELLDASVPRDWRTLDPANTLYLDLATGRVVIELAPDFAPAHVANIRTLAHEHYWDGLSINRSQDNFVVQWGDPAEDDAQAQVARLGARRTCPPNSPARRRHCRSSACPTPMAGRRRSVSATASRPRAIRRPAQAWLAHCYGTVGAGRDIAADSQQWHRALCRRRTIAAAAGSQHHRGRPRRAGHGIAVGAAARHRRRWASTRSRSSACRIKAIALASDVPEAQRMPLQLLRTDTPLFTAVVEARRNRRDDWYKVPAGHIDLCNVPLPVRAPPKP